MILLNLCTNAAWIGYLYLLMLGVCFEEGGNITEPIKMFHEFGIASYCSYPWELSPPDHFPIRRCQYRRAKDSMASSRHTAPGHSAPADYDIKILRGIKYRIAGLATVEQHGSQQTWPPWCVLEHLCNSSSSDQCYVHVPNWTIPIWHPKVQSALQRGTGLDPLLLSFDDQLLRRSTTSQLTERC